MNLAEDRGYTYADYALWDDGIRYELIDGIAYAMASPSESHQRISRKLLVQLDNFLRGKTCEVFHAPFDVRLNFDTFDDTVVQPDLLVVCDKSKLDGKGVRGVPDFIIEILSPTNTQHDTRRKYNQYQAARVREYWIVNPVRRNVEVYILKNKKYVGRIYSDDDIIPVHALKGCQINLTDVFYDIESIDNIELEIRQKVVDAFREVGISDEQIEKAVKKLKS